MRKLRAIPVVVLLLALAACGSSSKSSSGSSDSGSSSGSSTLSKSDFVSQGNAICKSGGKDVKTKTPSDPAAFATYLTTLNQQLKDARAKFAALNAPSDGQQLQKDFVASMDKLAAAIDAAKAKADAGDMQGVITAMGSVDSTALDKQLDDYGLKDCTSEA